MRLPDTRRDVLLLEPGVHALTPAALGAHDGGDEPIANVYVDSRGIWLQLREGLRGAYVNGRPVRHMAMLRAGDSLFLQGSEVLVVGREPQAAPEVTHAPRRGPVRCVLRAVGGPLHGRCFSLAQPLVVGSAAEADIRIDDARVAARHVEVQPLANGVAVAVAAGAAAVLVNGHGVDGALLQSGDQLVLAGTHRFIIEAPRPLNEPEKEPTPTPRAAPASRPMPRSARRIPWLLFAAALLAVALSLLLLYGAG